MCLRKSARTVQRSRERILWERPATTQQAVNEPACVGKRAVTGDAGHAKRLIAGPSVKHFGTSRVRRFKSRPMSAMSVRSEENTNRTEPIFAEHETELTVSRRTLYHYIDSGKLSIGNLDLRRKVEYRPLKRKKNPNEAFLNQKFRQERTYEDFLSRMTQASQVSMCR